MDTLVDKIVRGQANIDRMKAEIKTVTNSLWGWLLKNRPTSQAVKIVIPCGPAPGGREYRWEFIINPAQPEAPSFYDLYLGITGTRLYGSDGTIYLSDVAVVHVSLEKFVEGMLEQFPELKQFVIMPLWDAAGSDPALTN